MKVYDCVQGEPEWFNVRAGVLTASNAASVVTVARLQPAKFGAYAHKLIAERILRRPIDTTPDTGWMERGREMEPKARAWLASPTQLDVDIEEVGFCKSDDGRVGFSPDGFYADRTVGVELKTGAAHTHVGYALDPDLFVKAHAMQPQFSMWVSGIETWQLVSWNPRIEPVVITLKRDQRYMDAFDEHVPAFLARVDEAVQRLTALRMGMDPDDMTEEDAAAALVFG